MHFLSRFFFFAWGASNKRDRRWQEDSTDEGNKFSRVLRIRPKVYEKKIRTLYHYFKNIENDQPYGEMNKALKEEELFCLYVSRGVYSFTSN